MRNSIKDPTNTSRELQRDLACAEVNVDSSTIRKRLLQGGRQVRRTSSLPPQNATLTASMKNKSLKWAKKYQNWGKEDWRKVVFSNESHFEVHGQKYLYVQKSAGETLNNKHVQQAPKHPLKKMFWGCFTFKGTGRLCPNKGMMNSTNTWKC